MLTTVLRIAAPLVVGYLLGGIPFGVLVARGVYKVDITTLGSGNTGGTNVYRNLGWKAGLAVAALDVAKAAAPTALGLLVADPAWGPGAADWLAIAGGCAAALGHSYSPYIRMRGGKAVSSFGGIVLVLMPLAAAVLLPFFALVVAIVRIVSVASMLTAAMLPVVAWLLYPDRPALVVVSALAFVFIVWRHRTNISRLVRGEEPRIGKGGLALASLKERAAAAKDHDEGDAGA